MAEKKQTPRKANVPHVLVDKSNKIQGFCSGDAPKDADGNTMPGWVKYTDAHATALEEYRQRPSPREAV